MTNSNNVMLKMCTYKNIYKCKKSIYTHVHKSHRKIVFFRYRYMVNILYLFSDKININLTPFLYHSQLKFISETVVISERVFLESIQLNICLVSVFSS